MRRMTRPGRSFSIATIAGDDPDLPPLPAGTLGVGDGVDFGPADAPLTGTIQLGVAYPESALPPDASEEDLVLMQFDGATGTCVLAESAYHDAASDTFTVETDSHMATPGCGRERRGLASYGAHEKGPTPAHRKRTTRSQLVAVGQLTGQVVYLLDHHGREFVSSATSDEVARANARRPGGPPAGGYGEMAPAAELEFWSSAFRVDQVSTEEVAGERCYILSGAGPARLEEPSGDPRAQAILLLLREAVSIRIRIRCGDLWLHSFDVLRVDGRALVSMRYRDVNLNPRFDPDTFVFRRPAGAIDAPFFEPGRE